MSFFLFAMVESSAVPGPDCVFRYLKAEYALEALQRHEWKIGRLGELNDPLDCKPVLVDSNGLAFDQRHPFWQKIDEDYGIVCFSRVVRDPVIWSHYADGHHGIALGFNLPPHGLHEVTYHEDNVRPLIRTEQIEMVERGEAPLIDLIAQGYASKARSWGYEKEFRYILPLSICKMRGVHYFLDLPLRHLKFVILGVRCAATAADIYRILNSCTALMKPHSIQVWKAAMAQNSFDLELTRLEEESKLD